MDEKKREKYEKNLQENRKRKADAAEKDWDNGLQSAMERDIMDAGRKKKE